MKSKLFQAIKFLKITIFVAVFLMMVSLPVGKADASTWTNVNSWPHGGINHIRALTTGTDGQIWAAGDNGYTARWNGTSWVNTGQWPHGSNVIYALTTGTDGQIWAAGAYGYTARWNGTSWVSTGQWTGGSNGISALTTGTDGQIWAAG
ncbi:MAG: hypothetical protein C4575_01885, partial [Desulforudis sp.]